MSVHHLNQSESLTVCFQGDEMDYSVMVDMDHVWDYYQSTDDDDVTVKIRAVTWWIWVSYHQLL